MRFEITLVLIVFLTSNSLIYAAENAAKEIGLKSSLGLSFGSNVSPQAFLDNEKLSIVAVGDILLHAPLHKQALIRGHESLWSHVSPFLSNADMTYGNLEGPVAPGVISNGIEVSDPGLVFDERVYTSFPLFNYHETLIQDLVKTGFDVVSTANNHSLDRRSIGVDKTIQILTKYNLQFSGTRSSDDDRKGYDVWSTIVERNGFKIAWIACTFSTNGIKDNKNQVLHCFNQEKFIQKMIYDLSINPSIDAVVVTPHVGNEYKDLKHCRYISGRMCQKSRFFNSMDFGLRVAT